MEGLVLGVILGLGALFVFDAIARPEARLDVVGQAARIGPKGAGALAGGAVGFALTGWTVAAVAGAIVGGWTPSALSRIRSEKMRLATTEAIAEVSARLRDSLRSGIGMQDALSQAARNAPSVLAADLNRLVADSRVSGISAASEAFARRLDDSSADLLASALGLTDRLGARHTSELLDSLSESAAARALVLREARARQARSRLSARVVALAPLLLLLAIRRANPAFLEPFNTVAGQAVLALTFGMIAFGYLLMLRMARVDGGRRP